LKTIRREFLDHILFWSENDLSKKLDQNLAYYNESLGHISLNRLLPQLRKPYFDGMIFIAQSKEPGKLRFYFCGLSLLSQLPE
jgi:hypothetical protein